MAITNRPYIIFLVDAVGALLSTLLLCFLVAPFPNLFGMPRQVCYALAVPAAVFTIYSFCCFLYEPKNGRQFLIGILIANGLYACVSLVLMLTTWNQLTPLGIAYFTGEILVLFLLMRFEGFVLQKSFAK